VRLTEDQIMDRKIEAAIGGSGRRRTSGDAATMAGAEDVALLSIGEAPRALARAQARAAAR
jgi:hypothetical protein